MATLIFVSSFMLFVVAVYDVFNERYVNIHAELLNSLFLIKICVVIVWLTMIIGL